MKRLFREECCFEFPPRQIEPLPRILEIAFGCVWIQVICSWVLNPVLPDSFENLFSVNPNSRNFLKDIAFVSDYSNDSS